MAEKDGPYDRLVCSLTEQDAIVSFNWDVLLELAFNRGGREFSYLEEWKDRNSDPEWPTARTSKPVTFLLKPHGSISWFALLDRELLAVDLGTNWRTVGNSLTYYMLFLRIPLGSRDVGRSSLSHALASVPAIVPPTAAKMLSVGGIPADGFVHSGHERAMTKTWNMFAEFVCAATELVIIGYSLPGTDAASIVILKQFAPNTELRARKKVMIVDSNRGVVNRYRRLVHPDARLVCDDFGSFDPASIS